MKIAVCSDSFDFIQTFDNEKYKNIEIVNCKVETILFKHIEDDDIDAYIFSNQVYYIQKAINMLKGLNPFIPVLVINILDKEIQNADLYMSFQNTSECIKCMYKNLINYKQNFDKLVKLSVKSKELVNFKQCKYNPVNRLLTYKNEEIKRLSIKEGALIEILGTNFNNLVKRDTILEKIWRQTDYFASRSLDVYITGLRKMFREYDINLVINNISGAGLILEQGSV